MHAPRIIDVCATDYCGLGTVGSVRFGVCFGEKVMTHAPHPPRGTGDRYTTADVDRTHGGDW
jgi:hypothetical protein